MFITPKYVLKDGAKFAPTHHKVYFKLYKKKIIKLGFYGLFTKEFIPKGSIIARDGGKVLYSIKDIPKDYRYTVLIGKNRFLAPSDFSKMENLSYLNHSCTPNIGRIGGLIYISKRNIKPNEELTIDYATLVSDLKNWEMPCLCGSKNCRKILKGDDWKIPSLAKELWSEWLPFIQKKILSLGLLK